MLGIKIKNFNFKGQNQNSWNLDGEIYIYIYIFFLKEMVKIFYYGKIVNSKSMVQSITNQ